MRMVSYIDYGDQGPAVDNPLYEDWMLMRRSWDEIVETVGVYRTGSPREAAYIAATSIRAFRKVLKSMEPARQATGQGR